MTMTTTTMMMMMMTENTVKRIFAPDIIFTIMIALKIILKRGPDVQTDAAGGHLEAL